jgi:hypothetical protein
LSWVTNVKMCVRIYLDLYTSRTQVELTIQLIWFANFTYYLPDLLQPTFPPHFHK